MRKSKSESDAEEALLFEDATGVEPEEIGADESITEPFDPTLIRVANKPITIDLLVSRLKEGEINLSPDFQRKGGIWTEGAQSRLIESILIRIPLPAFYMDATDDEEWVVVDGLQRLTTLKRFVIQNDLRLSNLEFLTTLNGKKYRELSRSFQRRIGETQVTVYLIEPGTPSEVKFNIFKRINTGGLPLSSQEIRHALNQGTVTTFLRELASSNEFRTATSCSIRDDRMADREFVLRFLAFILVPYHHYKSKDFDSFLNDRMAEINRLQQPVLQNLRHQFLRAMRAAHRVFGNDAFRKRYSADAPRSLINKALFEAWAVNLSRLDDDDLKRVIERKQQVRERFIEVMSKDRDFDSAISQGTGDIRKVRLRFQIIEGLLQETLQ